MTITVHLFLHILQAIKRWIIGFERFYCYKAEFSLWRSEGISAVKAETVGSMIRLKKGNYTSLKLLTLTSWTTVVTTVVITI